jgi:hypothetical protein
MLNIPRHLIEKVHDWIGEVRHDAAVSQLDNQLAPIRSQHSVNGCTDPTEYIKGLENSYTMQAEREVHNLLLEQGRSPGSQGAAPLSPVEAKKAEMEKTGGNRDEEDEADLGDNVELF